MRHRSDRTLDNKDNHNCVGIFCDGNMATSEIAGNIKGYTGIHSKIRLWFECQFSSMTLHFIFEFEK